MPEMKKRLRMDVEPDTGRHTLSVVVSTPSVASSPVNAPLPVSLLATDTQLSWCACSSPWWVISGQLKYHCDPYPQLASTAAPTLRKAHLNPRPLLKKPDILFLSFEVVR